MRVCGQIFWWFCFAFTSLHSGLRIQLVVVTPAGYETVYAGPADTACDCLLCKILAILNGMVEYWLRSARSA